MESLHDLDPRAAVAANPFAAVGGAFVAGAMAAWRAGSKRRSASANLEAPRRGRMTALALSLGMMLAKRALREVAMHQITKYAKQRFSVRDDGDDHAYGHARA